MAQLPDVTSELVVVTPVDTLIWMLELDKGICRYNKHDVFLTFESR